MVVNVYMLMPETEDIIVNIDADEPGERHPSILPGAAFPPRGALYAEGGEEGGSSAARRVHMRRHPDYKCQSHHHKRVVT